MSRRPAGPRGGHDDAGLIVGAISALALALATAAWLPVALVQPPGYTGGGPIHVTAAVLRGDITWTTTCTLIAAAEVAALVLLTTTAVAAWRWARRRRTRVDGAARKMASRADLAHLGPKGVADSGRRLRPSLAGVTRPDPDQLGVLIGHTVAGGMPLRQSWEDMAVDIWGPRTGKTTSRAIPAIVAAPGPVLVTSVKGDIVDATRDIRAHRGTVWAFDLQHILGAGQHMWWNPLRAVATVTDARRLAEHFAAAERDPGVSRDAFFDPSSEELVANLLLASAVAGRDILTAYRWAVSPRDDEPATLLREHGYDLPADAVAGVVNMPDKTRGGIYAGAQKMLMCLTEPAVTAWVTPPTRGGIREFEPAAFATSTDVLYLLSQGGPGSPAPLVAALTDAVLRAGELRARASAGRRLDPPLLSILDEAANICRLRQLPNLYSYYGSHGLPIITILQSYPQGIDVWGREGMRKLWSAANIRTYGGGVADPDWLEELSKLIGEHDVTTRSTSSSGTGWGQRSVSHATRRQRILDISDLHALPRGRMIVYASGAPPALARTAPWQTGPHAAAIRASIDHWAPHSHTDWTLTPHTPPEPIT
ncbi:type IV secretory system conjugative DNA transfer family protein [Salinispora cortesiana]|uniref:type IV secretory system conjugative DNA transfer family protein n=1 Tax=Salinispora cortesiana TaxID=1305843 RepID=UPI00040F6309|nr:type IV secretory system conjugative DNA transfer family protein [Salinispora cortesiana]